MALVKTIQDFSRDAFMSALLPFDTTAGTHADGLSVMLAVHCHTKIKRFLIFTRMKVFLFIYFFLTLVAKAIKWDESLRIHDGALQMSPWSPGSNGCLC